MIPGMKRPFQRLRANVNYLRKPFLRFLPLLLLLVAVLVAGTFCFHDLGRDNEGRPLSLLRALYLTWCLIFMEHLLEFPEHWVLQLFYFLLPPLGLVVILDGLVRFSYHVLRRDQTGAEWIRAMAKTYHGHVVLCGLGRVGLRVLQQLVRLGEDVVVLEKNAAHPNLAWARKQGVPVLIGSGREEGILEELNLADAKSLIAATDDDLANLEIVLDARKLKPDIRVVLRMYDQELASKIRESFGIDLAFSTSSLAAPVFATSSSDRSILNSFYVGERLLVVAELTVNAGSPLAEKRIADIGAEHQVFFLSHSRDGTTRHFPPGETTFQPGDKLVVQTTPDTLKLLHQWNRDQPPY